MSGSGRPLRLLGVDPGQSGALAWLDDRGELVAVIDMPVTVGVNAAELASVILEHGTTVAIVEQVASMPKQGVASTFKFGVSYGVVQGVLAAYDIPTHYAHPSQWKRGMGLSRDKGVSRKRATDLWPASSGRFARVKDDGRAEAALLAHWWLHRNVGVAA